MKYLFAALIFIFFVPLFSQPSVQTGDTLWIEPFLASLKIVLSNSEQVDFVLLEPKYAKEVQDLPNGASFASSLSEIENYATANRKVYYICLTSFKIDSWGAQIEWKNISANYRKRTNQINYTTHVNFSFIYYQNGNNWSRGPSVIQIINHPQKGKNK
jgi:hypothetical protein